MIDRRLFNEIDWLLVGLMVLVCLIGVVFIYGSSHFLPGSYHLKQLVWMAVGLLVMTLIASVDYKFLLAYSPVFYVLTVAVLAGLLAWANLVAGTKSWFRTGLFQVQPSEAAKVVMILVLARIFAGHRERFVPSRLVLLTLAVAFVPLALITLQPDLGTVLTFLPLVGGALVLAGLKKKTVALFLVASIVVGVGGWNLVLRDYQKKRVVMLLNPHQDARGAGYQVIQSRIAVGSGGFTGKGFMKGSQSQLRFLPARHTDFIFSVIGEELGFVGVLLIMVLYALILARIFLTVPKARDRSGVYIVFLAGMLIAFQFLINIMMVVGLFPVTGVTLPFLSYGGSSLISSFAACGLVINVGMRRLANV
jgi:rod shape determining protein RodA